MGRHGAQEKEQEGELTMAIRKRTTKLVTVENALRRFVEVLALDVVWEEAFQETNFFKRDALEKGRVRYLRTVMLEHPYLREMWWEAEGDAWELAREDMEK